MFEYLNGITSATKLSLELSAFYINNVIINNNDIPKRYSLRKIGRVPMPRGMT